MNQELFDKFRNTPLMYACASGKLDMMKDLLGSDELKKHTKLYQTNKEGWNILMFASINNHKNILEYLIIEENFKVDDFTMKWLIKENQQEALKMLESRDLYNRLDDNLDNTNKIIKHRKI